jgi:hypothetical protein
MEPEGYCRGVQTLGTILDAPVLEVDVLQQVTRLP